MYSAGIVPFVRIKGALQEGLGILSKLLVLLYLCQHGKGVPRPMRDSAGPDQVNKVGVRTEVLDSCRIIRHRVREPILGKLRRG
jgi:hypothetical protein